MTPNEFVRRVTLDVFVGVGALALAIALVAGPAVGAGVLAGGLLGGVNFRWLAARVRAISAGREHQRSWIIGAAVRFVLLLSLAAGLLITGYVDPIGFVVGMSVLPCAVILVGLRATRQVS